MDDVVADLEQQLAAAAEALHEFEAVTRCQADLRGQITELTEQVAALRATHAEEQKDVDRLEGLTLSRVLAALSGSRDDALLRERAEADAALYRVTQAETQLAVLKKEHDAAGARLIQLSISPRVYAALLDEKERRLTQSGDPRGARLLEIADERGRLDGAVREIREALRAAGAARRALSFLEEELASLSRWSKFDMYGGGKMTSWFKYARLDEVAHAATSADQCVALLRTKLPHVERTAQAKPLLAVDNAIRFGDVWFDNFFTDRSVQKRIERAQRNTTAAAEVVSSVTSELEQRMSDVSAKLAAVEAARRGLLTGG